MAGKEHRSTPLRVLRPAERGPPGAGERFIGRERELGEIRAATDGALSGRGGLLVFSGEPGIGKTRLADEAGARAALRGMRVVWGRCWEGGGAPAYWPWIQVIRGIIAEPEAPVARSRNLPAEIARMLPELASEAPAADPRGDAEQARFRLFDAVAALLKNSAREHPLLIVIDDLHDADQPSLQMLRFVARETKDARILIVGTYRDAEVKRSPQLGKLVGDLIREGHLIPIAGLSQTEVGQLVESVLGHAAEEKLLVELCRATDGNPLFVDGVMRLLAAEGKLDRESFESLAIKTPDGVRESVRRRMAMLSQETVSMLSIASVIGNEFESRLLEQVSGIAAEQTIERMEDASRAGIVIDRATRDSRYQFSHALIRKALYEDLPASRRFELHGLIAEVIENVHKDDLQPHLAQLAHHFRAARVADKAIDYSIRAGEAALAALAYEEAVRHWEAALNLMESQAVEPERRGRLTVRLSEAWFPIDLAQMIHCLERAVTLFEHARQPDASAAARASLALQYAKPDDETITNIPLATEHLRRVEQAVTQMPQTRHVVLDYFLAKTVCAATSLHRDEGITAAQRGMELSECVGDREHWVFCAGILARHLLFCGRIKEALALLDRARERADQIGLPLPLLRTAENRSDVLLRLSNPSTAQIWIREFPGFRVAELPFHSRLLAQQLCAALLIAGELSEAASLIAQARKPVLEGMLAFRLGDWDRAEIVWTEGLSRCKKAGARDPASDYLANLTDLHLARGRHASAESLLLQLLAAALDAPQTQLELHTRASLARLYAEMDRYDEARAHLERCQEILSEGEDWRGLAGGVERAEAVVAAAQGEFPAADGHFEGAIATFRHYCLPWEEADTLHYWGRALNAIGEHGRANEKLDSAIEIYRRHIAGERWIDRVMAEMPSENAAGPSATATSAVTGQTDCIFRREGEYWTISYLGSAFRLRNSKGLRYLAHLLSHPGDRCHARELAAIDAGSPGASAQAPAYKEVSTVIGGRVARDLGDAGEMIDPKAKAAYKRRLNDLHEELDEAERFNDTGRAERFRQEIEFVTGELRAAVGIAGRARKTASHADRIRDAVSKRIRDACQKIGRYDPELARHLAASIRTGYYCAYLPTQPIAWRF